MTYLINAGAFLIVGILSVTLIGIWAIRSGRLIINRRIPKPKDVKQTTTAAAPNIINKPKVVYGKAAEVSEMSEINQEIKEEKVRELAQEYEDNRPRWD